MASAWRLETESGGGRARRRLMHCPLRPASGVHQASQPSARGLRPTLEARPRSAGRRARVGAVDSRLRRSSSGGFGRAIQRWRGVTSAAVGLGPLKAVWLRIATGSGRARVRRCLTKCPLRLAWTVAAPGPPVVGAWPEVHFETGSRRLVADVSRETTSMPTRVGGVRRWRYWRRYVWPVRLHWKGRGAMWGDAPVPCLCGDAAPGRLPRPAPRRRPHGGAESSPPAKDAAGRALRVGGSVESGPPVKGADGVC